MKKLFDTGLNLQGVELKKTVQKRQIVRALYFNGAISNAELSRTLQLSAPKISSLLRELISDELVKELGQGDSSGGRRPAIYGLADDGFFVAGITINTYRTIFSLFNANNMVVSGPHCFPVKMKSDLDIFRLIRDFFEATIAREGFDKSKIIAIGMELPGLINPGISENKTYFAGMQNLDKTIEKVFGIPVFFDNDAKIRAFAEQHFGLAKGRDNVLVIHTDWGIAIGLILNGRLYTGKSGFTGEFGHMPIVEGGILCPCGKKGCLETVASATAIARMAREGLVAGEPSLLSNLASDLETIETGTVIQAACSGDQFSIGILSNAGFWLGRGIAYMLQIFNPELIIIGGKVAEAGQFIIAPIRQAVYTYSNHDISNDCEITFSTLAGRAGTMGAAAFAVNQLANI